MARLYYTTRCIYVSARMGKWVKVVDKGGVARANSLATEIGRPIPMWYVDGVFFLGADSITWDLRHEEAEDEGVTLTFDLHGRSGQGRKMDYLRTLAAELRGYGISWIVPGAVHWTLDLSELVKAADLQVPLDWCSGIVRLEPDVEIDAQKTTVSFYITPDATRSTLMQRATPVEIHDSLVRFQQRFPNSSQVAFIMMAFEQTSAHTAIVEAIKSGLQPLGISAIRADEGEYHTDMFYNVLTYIYGCEFGVAVFERITNNLHNPNVALEVGYMMALGKSVCLLKDKTVDTLQSDLVHRLYKPFDFLKPAETIPGQLERWMADWRPSSARS